MRAVRVQNIISLYLDFEVSFIIAMDLGRCLSCFKIRFISNPSSKFLLKYYGIYGAKCVLVQASRMNFNLTYNKYIGTSILFILLFIIFSDKNRIVTPFEGLFRLVEIAYKYRL